jgi:hypothetical protein
VVPNLQVKKSNFVSGFVEDTTRLLEIIGRLTAERQEWDALGMAPGSGTPYELTQDDLVGTNEHLTPEDVASAFASLDAQKALLLQGHLTNLARVRR